MQRNDPDARETARTAPVPSPTRGGIPRRLIRGLRTDCSGATAVEFAMVGSTFFSLLLLATLFSVFYLRVTMLDLAVQKVSRQLMTNQTLTQSQFIANVKTNSFGMLQNQTVNVAVQSASTFAAITPVANVAAGGSLPYSTGTNGSDVLIQVGYTDSTLGSLLPSFITNVSSTIAFQREPSGQ
jgi:Flp pilus assembly protein TadG